MQRRDKIFQLVGIPHSAFLSVVFGMMLASFPMGMFVVFHSSIGGDITSALPLGSLYEFQSMDIGVLSGVELGDVFLILWSVYAILFAISVLGPKAGFIKTVSAILSRGKIEAGSNYMVSITQWFSITILVSAGITYVQEWAGLPIVPPPVENDLVQFFFVSLSPLAEEFGFRMLLIGLPLFALYGYKTTVWYFLKSLWNPSSSLHIYSSKKPLLLIILVGVLFGFAHIAVGDAWSEGKFAQATAGGIILGWVYFRFGFLAALLIHWATNYFIFAYANFLAQINETSVASAFSHPLITTMEILFLVSGALSVVVLVVGYYYSWSQRRLEV